MCSYVWWHMTFEPKEEKLEWWGGNLWEIHEYSSHVKDAKL